ncbi:hypothetical protein TRV_00723 [Trichophyton verrucosum HKI 0517]|uniref:Uncharacterized protein n=1 Tax=Trichophyton verrucosum (strain HKI 0517) TaxID=663202 RepID=D4D0X7_TRIVH|nr:uncharacterized protein TRV_00723 [Trichophyton verrucosum HKI 0517]EFE44454.1 hypothetical protein TRV_00723 [Trichophyton verrucosum HKI 0517]
MQRTMRGGQYRRMEWEGSPENPPKQEKGDGDSRPERTASQPASSQARTHASKQKQQLQEYSVDAAAAAAAAVKRCVESRALYINAHKHDICISPQLDLEEWEKKSNNLKQAYIQMAVNVSSRACLPFFS